MESQINEVLRNGAMIDIFFGIVSAGITLWIGNMVQILIKNMIAKRRIEDSTVLAVGVILRYPTSTSFRDGILAEFGRTHTRVDFDSSSKYFLNEAFASGDFEIVKPGCSTMKTQMGCDEEKP